MLTTNYTITGLTCGGCKAFVEQKIQAINGVQNVTVHLEQQSMSVSSSSAPNLSALQAVLPSKYSITLKGDEVKKSLKKSELKALQPLFIIFFGISIVAVLFNFKSWSLNNFMLDFMGLFYFVFSVFKLLDLKGFTATFTMYDPLAAKYLFYAYLYPFIELLLAGLFFTRFQIPFALIATLIILGITTFGVTKALLGRKKIACACLGTLLKLPMTKATFIENTIMICMALYMLFK